MSKSNLITFQNIGTLLALLISVLALVVSIYEANLLKVQQSATVWPYVTVEGNYNAEGFYFTAQNNGTGPALIKSVEVSYQGQPVRSYDELLDRINPERKIGYDRLRMNRLGSTVLKVGETRVLFSMPRDEETREMEKQMTEVNFKIHYMSVLQDSWIYDLAKDEHSQAEFTAQVEFEN
ncbi:MAG: hypothetical protein ACFB15_13170 [Cyclobacteriaceae bacterium]